MIEDEDRRCMLCGEHLPAWSTVDICIKHRRLDEAAPAPGGSEVAGRGDVGRDNPAATPDPAQLSLVEEARLNERAREACRRITAMSAAWGDPSGCDPQEGDGMLVGRVRALLWLYHDSERRNFALAANQCKAGYSGEAGDHMCRLLDALRKARAFIVYDGKAFTANPLTEIDAAIAEVSRARSGRDLLGEAAKEMLADHMTSDQHHPDYVLVPASAFNKLRAATGGGHG